MHRELIMLSEPVSEMPDFCYYEQFHMKHLYIYILYREMLIIFLLPPVTNHITFSSCSVYVM